MMNTTVLKEGFAKGNYRDLLSDIYIDENQIEYQTKRYISAIEKYEKLYGSGEVDIYSSPGRSEVCGNHTDHQQGEILAASINLDAIAITGKLDENIVKIISDGYDEIVIDLNDIQKKEAEAETTTALIKGVLAGAVKHGYKIGGFQSYITSDVLIGAGLSSSAAFETVIGAIISFLFNDGKLDNITNAIIGQYAENEFFGKPCGLMDQMACAVGSLVHVDFADKKNPVVEKVSFDMECYGYSLCITDTKGSHADLTDDYAAVPLEMKKVAAYFGKEVLLGIEYDDVIKNIDQLRTQLGDRAVLRAMHFINENQRVREAVAAIRNNDMLAFLSCIKASGDSSYKYLQNVYTNSDVCNQSVSIALAVSEQNLTGEKGVTRVHGGGFAGTIQAFVKNDAVREYRKNMDEVFGTGACKVLKIRKYGAMKVIG